MRQIGASGTDGLNRFFISLFNRQNAQRQQAKLEILDLWVPSETSAVPDALVLKEKIKIISNYFFIFFFTRTEKLILIKAFRVKVVQWESTGQ